MIKQYLLIACIFAACAKKPDYVKAADQINKEYVGQLQNARCLGSGFNYVSKKVSLFYLDLEMKKSSSVIEAKTLLQRELTSYLAHINSQIEKSVYFEHFPLEEKDVSISIQFVDEKGKIDKELSQIAFVDGRVELSSFDSQTKSFYPLDLFHN